MKRKGSCLLVLLLFLALNISAQETSSASRSDDVGLNIEVAAEKKLSKKVSLGIEGELRLKDNISDFDRFDIGVSAEYKFMKWLKGSAGVNFMLVENESKESFRDDGSLKWIRAAKTTPRYRAFVSFTGSYSIARFKFSLRERYQFTYRSAYNTTRDRYTSSGEYNYTEDVQRSAKSYNVLRSRLQISYDIHHCPLSPYAYAEIYNSFNDAFKTKKLRYSVGIDWRVNKKNALSLAWTFQDVRGEDDDNDVDSHLIGVGYTFKF